MAVGAIGYNRSTDAGALCAAAARALRDAREAVLRAHAAIDQLRDGGATGAFFQQKTGCPDATEAGKLFDEMSSLKSKVESVAPDTFGAATLQACAKLGV